VNAELSPTAGIAFHPSGMRRVDALVPYERNARTHSQDQVGQIAAAMREWGFTNPLLVDEQDRILAGHGRLEAARLLGLAEVPVVVVSGLTDAQRRALVLADNKLALNAGWDQQLLLAELEALQADDFDLALAGFSAGEVLDLLGGSGSDANPDEAPAVPPVPFSRPGDVWTLGPHRLVVGDSTSPTVYDQLLGTEKVDACWTDPPYNVAYSSKAGEIANDNLSDGDFATFLRDAFLTMFLALKPGAAVYVAHADTEGLNFRSAFAGAGFKLSGVLIWRKDALVLGRSDYQWQHEPILYGWRPGSRHRWYGGRKLTTVQSLGEGSPFQQAEDGAWVVRVGERALVIRGDFKVEEVVPTVIDEPRPRRSDDHPTMKPVALIERMLRASARPNDLVLDPFGGSGSTLIAAERLGMCARLIELDPGYADVIVRRWQTYSGRRAQRDDGVLFPEEG
jgi:DNA modification methylase